MRVGVIYYMSSLFENGRFFVCISRNRSVSTFPSVFFSLLFPTQQWKNAVKVYGRNATLRSIPVFRDVFS